MASLIGSVEDLVVEDGEVKGQTQADGVGGGKVGRGDFGRGFVGLEGGIGSTLTAVADGELGQITVVVTLPVRKQKSILALGARHREREGEKNWKTYILW